MKLTEICSFSSRAHPCRSTLSQVSSLYTQNLTPASQPYPSWISTWKSTLPWTGALHPEHTNTSDDMAPTQESSPLEMAVPQMARPHPKERWGRQCALHFTVCWNWTWRLSPPRWPPHQEGDDHGDYLPQSWVAKIPPVNRPWKSIASLFFWDR